MKKEMVEKIKEIILHPGMEEGEKLFAIRTLMEEADRADESRHPSLGLDEIFDRNRASLLGQEPLTGLMSAGFSNLDRLVGGFSTGEYIVIGGRPGMGKTMLLVNLALQMSKDQPVLYFSFELNAYMLTCRCISVMTHIPVGNILQGRLSKSERFAVSETEARLKKRQIFVSETYNNSIKALRLHCEKMIKEKGIRVIIIDYLQLMSSFRFRSQRELEMSYLSRELKSLARDLDICIIVGSQLSRAVEVRGGAKRPILPDLRDSGSIEQDADKVIFLYRPEYYCIEEWEDGRPTEGDMELLVAKNRNGPMGSVILKHSSDFSTLTERDDTDYQLFFEQGRLDELSSEPGEPF